MASCVVMSDVKATTTQRLSETTSTTTTTTTSDDAAAAVVQLTNKLHSLDVHINDPVTQSASNGQLLQADDTATATTDGLVIVSSASSSASAPAPAAAAAAAAEAAVVRQKKVRNSDDWWTDCPATQSSSALDNTAADHGTSDHDNTGPHQQQQQEGRVQRKSWAGDDQSADFHALYHAHHLRQSESLNDIATADYTPSADATTTTTTTTTPGELGNDNICTPGVMLFSSARRRLGRKRSDINDNTAANDTTTTIAANGEVCSCF